MCDEDSRQEGVQNGRWGKALIYLADGWGCKACGTGLLGIVRCRKEEAGFCSGEKDRQRRGRARRAGVMFWVQPGVVARLFI